MQQIFLMAWSCLKVQTTGDGRNNVISGMARSLGIEGCSQTLGYYIWDDNLPVRTSVLEEPVGGTIYDRMSAKRRL